MKNYDIRPIMGHSWEDIQAMQQGTYKAPKVDLDREAHKLQIISDMERIRLPVAKSVADAYQIEIPNGYILNSEDVYVFDGIFPWP